MTTSCKNIVFLLVVVSLALSCEQFRFDTGMYNITLDVIYDGTSTKCENDGPSEFIDLDNGSILPMTSEVGPLETEEMTKGNLIQNNADFISQVESFTLCVLDGETKVVDNVLVTYDPNTSSWNLPAEVKWGWGKELEFIAWTNDAGLSVDSIVHGTGNTPTIINFDYDTSESRTIEGTEDALVGYYKGTGEKGKATLRFFHLYGGIRFKVSPSTDDFEEGTKILSVTLKDAIDKGTGILTLGENQTIDWSGSETSDVVQSFGDGISISDFNALSEQFILPEYNGSVILKMYLPSEGNKTFKSNVESPGVGQSRVFTIKRTGIATMIHGGGVINGSPGFNILVRRLYTSDIPDPTLGNSCIKKIKFDVKSSANTGLELQTNNSTYKIRANVAPDGTAVISTPADEISLSNADDMFANMTALEEIEGLENLDTRTCLGFLHMFKGCGKIKSVQFGEHFQILTDNVYHMPQEFFYDCKSLTQVDMTYPFRDLSNCTSLRSFFRGCASLEEVIVPESINTSNVRDMSAFFFQCRNLDIRFVEKFDTRNVTTMNNMFSYVHCDSTLDLSNFNTSKVNSMYHMFYQAQINNLVMSSFSSESLTDVRGMFALSAIPSIEFGPSFNIRKVQSIASMFESSRSISSIDLSMFMPDSLNTCQKMFFDCRNLSDIVFGENFTPLDTCNVTQALDSIKFPATIKCNTATKNLLDTDVTRRDAERTTFETY